MSGAGLVPGFGFEESPFNKDRETPTTETREPLGVKMGMVSYNPILIKCKERLDKRIEESLVLINWSEEVGAETKRLLYAFAKYRTEEQ